MLMLPLLLPPPLLLLLLLLQTFPPSKLVEQTAALRLILMNVLHFYQ